MLKLKKEPDLVALAWTLLRFFIHPPPSLSPFLPPSYPLLTPFFPQVPYTLRDMASNALLHSYKFLTPNYGLTMAVTRHDDVEVLVATIDEAWMTVTVADGGEGVSRHLNRYFKFF